MEEYVVMNRVGEEVGRFLTMDEAKEAANRRVAPGAGYTIIPQALANAAAGILKDLAGLDGGPLYEAKDDDRTRLNTALKALG